MAENSYPLYPIRMSCAISYRTMILVPPEVLLRRWEAVADRPWQKCWLINDGLQAAGIRVHVRGTRGDDESAACGQLVTGRKEKKKPVMKVV